MAGDEPVVNCANPVSTVNSVSNLSTFIGDNFYNPSVRAFEPQTVTIQLYGDDNQPRTTGGEAPTFKLEKQCTISDTDLTCIPTGAGSSINGLPIEGPMTDNMDGTYSYTFTTPGGGIDEAVTVSASISLLTAGGLYAEYYDNKERTGDPVGTRTENPNNEYGRGIVGLSGSKNMVGATWSGKLCAPTSETHTFKVRADDTLEFQMNDIDLSIPNYNGGVFVEANSVLTADTLYDIDISFTEVRGGAFVNINWLSDTNPTEREVPDSALWSV